MSRGSVIKACMYWIQMFSSFLSYPLITDAAATAFRSFISQMIIVNLDFRIAELAAQIRRKHGVKLLDAIVGATAFSTNSILVAKNTRDFNKITNLRLFEF